MDTNEVTLKTQALLGALGNPNIGNPCPEGISEGKTRGNCYEMGHRAEQGSGQTVRRDVL